MLKQLILSPQCLHCTSLGVQNHLFCRLCFERIALPKIIKSHKFFINAPHVFLIPWELNDYKSIDQLVYRLKNMQSEKAFQFYLEHLAKLLQKLNFQKTENILIPIPSARSKFNHAHFMAKQLSLMGFGRCMDVLSKQKGHQQKHLSRRQRSQNEFFIKPEYEDFTRSFGVGGGKTQQVLFIDDVLTTGESFKRCSELLGVSEKALCVTLFYREKAQ